MASVGNGDVEHIRPSGIDLARQRWWVARIVNGANQSIRVNTIASIVGKMPGALVIFYLVRRQEQKQKKQSPLA